MPLKCHIFQLLPVQVWNNYVSIYTSYELIAVNSPFRGTAIHTFPLLTKGPDWNMPAILHIYVPLHYYAVCIKTPKYCIHPSKINNLQYLYTILLHNMLQQQIHVSNTINIAYVQITQCHTSISVKSDYKFMHQLPIQFKSYWHSLQNNANWLSLNTAFVHQPDSRKQQNRHKGSWPGLRNTTKGISFVHI